MGQHGIKPDSGRVLDGARVLIVEDDFIIALDLETTLTEAGARITGPCRTVKEALATLDGAGESPEAAILDIRLGKETVAPVAQQLCERGIPFMFYTGQVDTDPIRRAWPDHKIVSKPANYRTILAAVAAMLA
ncbi:MAG TPA: response regulator [Methylocella sp.]|nr:response regulator [Methylocella sp.]